MKKLLFIFFVFSCVFGYAQSTSLNIGVGKYEIKTRGTTDNVTKWNTAVKAEYDASVVDITLVDTVFYVPSTAPTDTIFTLMGNRPSGKIAAILLQRGSIIDTTITIADDSLVISSYGTGNKVKFVGSAVIDSFSNYSGSIYRASYSDTIRQLFYDDVKLKLAKLQTIDYDTITEVINDSVFISTDLDSQAVNYYVGARVHIRTNDWTLSVDSVVWSNGDTIEFDSPMVYDPTDGNLFFMNNKLEFLDEAGEWYYDEDSNYVYVWLPDSTDPAGYEMRGSVRNNGIVINDKDYVTIKSIDFSQFSDDAVNTDYADYLTIFNCKFSDSDGAGLMCYPNYNTNMNISYNEFTGLMDYGMRARAVNATIQYNNFHDIALFDDIGFNGVGVGNAIGLDSGNDTDADNLISYNDFTDIGKNGISFKCTNSTIEYNYINGACVTLTDGAAIYTFTKAWTGWGGWTSPVGSEGTVIRNNLIVDAVGWYNYATGKYGCHGIYLDEGSNNMRVEYNTILGAGYSSIYVHYGFNDTIENNYSFDSPAGVLLDTLATGNVFQNNTLITYDRDGTTAWWTDAPQRLLYQKTGDSTATWDYNTYISPYATSNAFQGYATFDAWKSGTGQDANSTGLFGGLIRRAEEVFYNETADTVTTVMNDSVVWFDYAGDTVVSIDIPPYSGQVVLRETPSTITNGLIAAWEHNETSGATLYDAWTNGLNGVITGSTVNQTGKLGKSHLLVDTELDFSTVSDNDLLTFDTDGFTISAWVNPSATEAVYHPIYDKRNEVLLMIYDGRVYFRIFTGGTSTYGGIYTTNQCINPGEWNHIVATCDAGTLSRSSLNITVNGTLQSRTNNGDSGTITISNTAYDVLIGKQAANSYYWEGLLDQVIIWNRPLTTNEKAEVYNNGDGIEIQ